MMGWPCWGRFFSFFGNLAGSLFIVFLVDETLLFQTGVAAGVANAKAVAVAKTSATFGTTVVRGLLCNWLVSTSCSPSFDAFQALALEAEVECCLAWGAVPRWN